MTHRKSMRRTVNIWSRKLHRWGAILSLVPMIVIVVTGLLLQVRKQWSWVQPVEQRGSDDRPAVSFEEILAAARRTPDANIQSWSDINRIDIRPNAGLIKVRGKNNWEIQIDAATGDVLGAHFRRSHIIEAIHEGSFFGSFVQVAIFWPAGVILLGLLISGAYLWILPIVARRNGRRRRAYAAHH